MTVAEDHLKQIITAAISESTAGLKLSIDETRAAVAEVHERLAFGDRRMDGLADGLAKNNADTAATRKSSAEMQEAFDFAKRGLAFIGACASFIGKVVTWVVKVGIPIGTAYAVVKGWKWPWTK